MAHFPMAEIPTSVTYDYTSGTFRHNINSWQSSRIFPSRFFSNTYYSPEMKLPLISDSKAKRAERENRMLAIEPVTKDLTRNSMPFGSNIQSSNILTTDEELLKSKKHSTAIVMARMMSSNQSFTDSIMDEGSESGDHRGDSDLNDVDDFITDYDGDSITDYDGIEVDFESHHQRQLKAIPPPPAQQADNARTTHQIEFDPLELGRESSHNKISRRSMEDNSSSGKNSALSFSEKTSCDRSNSKKKRNSNSRVKTIVRGETKRIKRWKLASMIVVIVVGLVFSFLLFFQVYQTNVAKYDDSTPTVGDDPFFYKAVFHLEDSANLALRRSVQSLEAISRALTEYANSDKGDIGLAGNPTHDFPFVTLPNFRELTSELYGMTNATTNELFSRVFWAPIIDASVRDEWEQYSFDNQAWILNTGEGIENVNVLEMPVQIAPSIHSNLKFHSHRDDDEVWSMSTRFQYSKGEESSIESFLPAWQAFDFVDPNGFHDEMHGLHQGHNGHQMDHSGHQMDHSGHQMDHGDHTGHRRDLEEGLNLACEVSFVNFDLNTWFTPAAAAFKDDHTIMLDDDDYVSRSQLDGAVHVWNDPPFDLVDREHEHLEDGSNCNMSLFIRVPIYDNLESQFVVGYVFALLHEELGLFRGGLREETEAMPLRLVVKEERKGRAIETRRRTYEIRGSQISFIGEGDHHDKKYDDKVYKFKVRSQSEESTSSTVYLLYPTDEFFITTKILNARADSPMISLSERYPAIEAIWSASLVASVFAVILILFVCYDNSVEDRQRKLLRQAERTDAIVGSMFPANIQGRLMMIDDDTIESSKRGHQRKLADRKETEYPLGFESSTHTSPTQTDGTRSSLQLTNTSFHQRLGRKHGHGNWNRFHSQPSTPQSTNDMKADESILRFGNTKPMADFYPNTTILMCDIAGFTAWSSARAPADVFRLLETIYGAFDDIARSEKVFKVETVGDCYVACAGLPVRQPKHAVIMAKFARKALKRYETLIKKLETYLGPDTVDLGLRMGIHSGPVTAGVLRGDKTRFQLFGDTVNTASRMESTGRINMIQVSPQTANLLKEEGLGKWIVPREHLVEVKGKGQMQTHWLIRSGSSMSSTMSQASAASPLISAKLRKGTNNIWKNQPRRNSMGASNASWETSSTGTHSSGSVSSHPQRRHSSNENSARNSKERRLIEWMVETFMKSLKKISKHRSRNITTSQNDDFLDGKELTLPVLDPEAQIIDEIKEVIPIQEQTTRTSDTSVLGSLEGSGTSSAIHTTVPNKQVESQLRDYITVVSLLYHDHAFHNFEHCAHVLMSVLKLLSRILESKLNASDAGLNEYGEDHAYGITSDPLLEFSCLFSALIHDVDHTGVPNSQLVKENTTTAKRYHNRSVAEQHSIAVAWSLLMQPCYRELRECIYRTESEFNRFRQLVVNSVMATDIMDRELKKFRDNRWEKAFDLKNDLGFNGVQPQCTENCNRMATVVIEHMIQASDVAHTMQHWHVYLKFNERLFMEMYQAYRDGRAEKDPSEYWYEGELNFFKFYIIPLALKLKECGVFGVSGDEYFFHAESNRSEWALKGEEIVAEYMARVNNSRHTKTEDSPTTMRTKQLLKLPEEKSSSFRSTESLNSLV